MHGQHGDMLGTGARVLQYCTAPVTHIQDARFSRELHRLNTTHTVLLDYPIGSIDDQDMSNIITVTYDTVAQPRSTLLVRVNNYGDNTFTNGDMLNIKLCWPATMPYDFSIDHVYMHSNELVESVEDEFDLYVAVTYEFHAFSYDNGRFCKKKRHCPSNCT